MFKSPTETRAIKKIQCNLKAKPIQMSGVVILPQFDDMHEKVGPGVFFTIQNGHTCIFDIFLVR